MNISKQTILFCLLVLLQLNLVTGIYFALSSPWNWNWFSWYRSKNATSSSSLQNPVDNTTSNVYLPAKESKRFGQVLTQEENRLMKNLFGVISNIRRGKSNAALQENIQSTTTETINDITTETPLIVSDLNLSAAESNLSTIIVPFELVSTQAPTITNTIQLTESEPLLAESTTETNQLNQNATTMSTAGSIVNDTTTATFTESTTLYRGDAELAMSTTENEPALGSDATTTLLPLVSDPVVSLLISEINTQAPGPSEFTTSTQMPTDVTTTDNSLRVQASNQTEPVPSTTKSVFAESTSKSSTEPNAIIITTTSSSLKIATENEAVSEESTTELPTKPNEQFIRELIALRERQMKLNSASEMSTKQTALLQTTTNANRKLQTEVSTLVSVEVNTGISVVQVPLFSFLSTTPPTPSPAYEATKADEMTTTAETPQERENRKLPFAFYDNQPLGNPRDEGHFMSNFQDFYSDSDIFKGMMPVYPDTQRTQNHIEMQNSWFIVNNDEVR